MVRLLRKAILLIMVLLIGIGAANCGFLTGELKVNFIHDWNEALERAQAENKPIMINFYTNTCPYCKKLDSDTFSDEELSDFLNANFICLKSNADKSKLYQDYNVGGYPTTVFTSPEGTALGGIIGYHPPAPFLQYAQGILDKWEP